MALYEWDKFINTVLSHVKFKYDHRRGWKKMKPESLP